MIVINHRVTRTPCVYSPLLTQVWRPVVGLRTLTEYTDTVRYVCLHVSSGSGDLHVVPLVSQTLSAIGTTEFLTV